MGHISIFLVAALLLLYWIPGEARSCSCPSGTGCPQSPSRGYCQRRVTVLVPSRYQQTYYVSVSTRNTYLCTWEWGKKCHRSASRKQRRTRWATRNTYRSECRPYCCSGYTGAAPGCRLYCPCYNGGSCIAPRTCRCTSGWTGTNCQTPICTNGCNHGGTCSAPDVCTCASGVTGPHCAPMCYGKPDCPNGGTCTATDTCSCTPSWIGRRCELDIDECYTNTSNCQHNCNNTLGSFNCSCKKGYKTSQENLSQCEDIDECESNPCEHFCNNTKGSYECSCKKGYILIEDMNCIVPVLPEELTTAGAVGGLLGLLVILGVAAAAVIITLAFVRYKKRKCKDIPDEKPETGENKFVGDKVVYDSPDDYPEVMMGQSPAYSSLQQGKEEQKEEVRYDTQVVPKKKSSAPAYETVLYK